MGPMGNLQNPRFDPAAGPPGPVQRPPVVWGLITELGLLQTFRHFAALPGPPKSQMDAHETMRSMGTMAMVPQGPGTLVLYKTVEEILARHFTPNLDHLKTPCKRLRAVWACVMRIAHV